jgi:hypothetical protein
MQSSLQVAAVLARAGLADSARHVVGRSLGHAGVDPTRDLVFHAAFVYTLLGDTTRALQNLKVYLVANPAKRATLGDGGWWFRPLRANQDFRRLLGIKD